jgi:hypothetical protein
MTPTQSSTKKKSHTAGSILDDVSWVIGQIALPIPDFLFRKKKKNLKK